MSADDRRLTAYHDSAPVPLTEDHLLGGAAAERDLDLRLSDMDARGRLRLDAVARYLQDVASDDVDETGWGSPITCGPSVVSGSTWSSRSSRTVSSSSRLGAAARRRWRPDGAGRW
jgi:hypothetical protein